MKPKASINLPQWIPFVWVAAALSLGSFMVENIWEAEWGTYFSAASVIADIILWDKIVVSLRERSNISKSLIVVIAIALCTQFLGVFFGDNLLIGILSLVCWVSGMIMISSKYSGAFQHYAVADLVCAVLLFVAIIFLAFVRESGDASDSKRIVQFLVCVMIFVVIYPYKLLATALKENEIEEKEKEEEKTDQAK